MPVIDEGPLRTAQRLARLANTAEEQPLAQAAVQAADHELDLAFMGALHGIQAHPPVLSPEALKIQAHIADAQKRLASDTELLEKLAQKMGKATEAEKPDLQDQLDLVGSQIEIEKDEIQEGNDDLMAAGGDVHQRIQKAQAEHLAAESNTAPPLPAPTVTAALSSLHGMVAQAREWLQAARQARSSRAGASRGGRRRSEAHRAARADRRRLRERAAAAGAARRQGARGSESPQPRPRLPAAPATPRRRIRCSASRARSPSTSAGSWCAISASAHATSSPTSTPNGTTWSPTSSARWCAGCSSAPRWCSRRCSCCLFADRWLTGLLGRAHHIDRRQFATLRSVIGVGLQVVAVLLILFMLIGLPGQFGTMLGLAGAGLTVALKDFIVAFIGWFVLMGKNGIRVGDWVEINGVSGEVKELSVFHTVLLETGNWTDAGHPTGRRVTFTNSYAIEGHYFNFSTTGQWLWDELTVVVPGGRDPQPVVNAIQKEVTEATADSAREAEQEWQMASRGARGTTLSAKPGIAVRPAVGGVEIAVRYVTRASERYAMRARLYQAAVQLLAAKPAP